MGISKDVLSGYANDKSKFFNLPDNEELEVRYLSAEEVANHFDGGKTVCIRYHLEFNGREMLCGPALPGHLL